MRVFLLLLSVLFLFISPAFAKKAYPIGEKLEYKAYALGFVPVGSVWVDTTNGFYNNSPTVTFNGRCYGNYLVYLADVRLKSQLSVATDKSLYHHIEQFGTERRGRHLYFDWTSNSVKYVRLQKDDKYHLRATTKITPDVWDVFGAGLHIRSDMPTEVGDSVELKLIEKTKVFHLRFKAVEKKLLNIKGVGIFMATKIKFEAINLKKDEIFKGLLDLDKDLELWIESKTKTPLIFSSTVPFGFIRPRITLSLTKWHSVHNFKPIFYSQKELDAANK